MLPVILQVIRLIKPHSNRILRRGWNGQGFVLSVKASIRWSTDGHAGTFLEFVDAEYFFDPADSI